MQWIPNSTGVCPVPEGTLIDVMYRDGEVKVNAKALKYMPGREASQIFWQLDDMEADIVAWRYAQQENNAVAAPTVQASQPYMSAAQLDIYTKNFLAMSKGLQAVGGDVEAILRSNQELMLLMARNGLEIKLTLHPSISNI